MKNKVLKWELAGIFFIVIVGSLLHFIFEWSGDWKPLALIAAVNESVWEHLKLAFWPGVFWAVIEYRPLKNHTQNFLLAKTAFLYLAPAFIIISFYTYTGIIGRHILFVDIALFVAATVLGQAVSYKLLTRPYPLKTLNKAAVVCLVLILAAFSAFTFYPPELPLFMDSLTGSYGIPGN